MRERLVHTMREVTHYYPDDDQYEDLRVTAVNPAGDDATAGWYIGLSSGFSFWIQADSPVTPAVGMPIRMYGRGVGYTVRGVFLDGQRVYYKTEAEQDEEFRKQCEDRHKERRYDFEKNRADYDRRYGLLPEVFRRRLDRFRSNNPEFRWEYEPYELFVCEQAVVIAAAVPAGSDPARFISDFKELDFTAQQAMVPGLADGHSGNTFGAACALAAWFLIHPENVVRAHGALAPLVGSKEYGCVPRGSETPEGVT